MEEKTINKKYKIKMEVLTPLSVGRGADYDYEKGVHYVEKNNTAYLLDMRKMVSHGIDINDIIQCTQERDNNKMLSIIGNMLKDVSSASFTLPASTSNPLKVMIKNELCNRPIIPGSSLKGAISSHILKSIIEDDYKGNMFAARKMLKINVKDFFGDFSLGQSLMRFIKVSDFEFATGDMQFVNTKVFNLIKQGDSWKGGWKHGSYSSTEFSPTGFNTLYQSLMPGATAEGCILMSEQMFDVMLEAQRSMKKATLKTEKREYLNIDNLFLLINKHTCDLLSKEKVFFSTYNQADGNADILDSINELQDMIPQDGKSCILKMSAGSGFHSITGDWQYDDYTDSDDIPLDCKRNKYIDSKPKSRKIALWDGKKSMMGFVKMTIEK